MKGGIKLNGKRLNGCTLPLKEIKNLITSNKGILIFKDHSLFFVSYPNMKIKAISCEQRAVKPVFFVSNDFENLKQIVDDDYTYIIEFDNNYLFVRDPITGEIKLTIKGEGY